MHQIQDLDAANVYKFCLWINPRRPLPLLKVKTDAPLEERVHLKTLDTLGSSRLEEVRAYHFSNSFWPLLS